MKDLAIAGRAILLDLASTLFFLALYALTRNVVLAVALGMGLAGGQIAWRLMRRQPVDALQWISLLIIAAGGGATLFTRNPVFVMLKPTAIYLLVAAAMLKKGWMTRYMPERALRSMPDLIVISGYAWAGLMVFSAALNLVLALTCSVIVWGTVMGTWGIASKAALFFGQYAVMKTIGKRRARAAA